MKKVLSMFFALLFLMSTASLAVAAAAPEEDYGVAPCYNNTSVASVTLSINSSGRAQVSLHCSGINGVTTKIVAESKIQKKFGIIWTNVSGAEWTDTANTYYMNKTHYHQLSKTGTYRVKTTYTVSGTGGSNDKITVTSQDTY